MCVGWLNWCGLACHIEGILGQLEFSSGQDLEELGVCPKQP